MIDLAVAYRIYPGISKSPAFYPQDKYLLSQMCLRSFRASLGTVRAKVWAILDGCPAEYESLFRETLRDCDLEIVKVNKVGNFGTFDMQIDTLASQTEAKYVYFAEDDYFYLPGALEKMLLFLRSCSDVDFVTPYDHPDSYIRPSCIESHLVRPHEGQYWRTASSTCLTFMTSRDRLAQTRAMLRTYSLGNGDYPVWQALTQRLSLLDPRLHFQDSFHLKGWLKIWRWGIPTLLSRRPYRLWAPIPTLATHMESTCLSPGFDWPQVFQKFEETWHEFKIELTPEEVPGSSE